MVTIPSVPLMNIDSSSSTTDQPSPSTTNSVLNGMPSVALQPRSTSKGLSFLSFFSCLFYFTLLSYITSLFCHSYLSFVCFLALYFYITSPFFLSLSSLTSFSMIFLLSISLYIYISLSSLFISSLIMSLFSFSSLSSLPLSFSFSTTAKQLIPIYGSVSIILVLVIAIVVATALLLAAYIQNRRLHAKSDKYYYSSSNSFVSHAYTQHIHVD